MHASTGADPFDDLLPDVASFSETQSALLPGFLRQIAITDVLPVARYP